MAENTWGISHPRCRARFVCEIEIWKLKIDCEGFLSGNLIPQESRD